MEIVHFVVTLVRNIHFKAKSFNAAMGMLCDGIPEIDGEAVGTHEDGETTLVCEETGEEEIV